MGDIHCNICGEWHANVTACPNQVRRSLAQSLVRDEVVVLRERIAALEAALAGAVPVEVAREAAGWAHALHHGVAPLTREYVLGLMLNDALFRTEVDRCLARALAEHAASAARGKGDSADA